MNDTMVDKQTHQTKINTRIGRVLIFVYGLFALSAGARSGVEIATKFHVAPLAYTLSAIAAVIYIVATVCLIKSTPTTRMIAIGCCSVELIFVIAVGIATLVDKSAFPDSTVWSGFGYEYGYVPLVLPIAGLWWLLRGATRTAHEPPSDPSALSRRDGLESESGPSR